MARMERSIEINVPPEKVWPLMQLDRWPEWYIPLKKVEWTSKDKNKVGSTYHQIVQLGRNKGKADGEITEVAENEKISMRSTNGPMKGTGVISLSPTKAGTKVTVAFEYELAYSVLGKLIDKVSFHKALDESYDVALKKLKGMLEK